MRSKVLITAWLAAPIVVFAGLIVWIFADAERPRLMHETPRGAGAGDTGGANAIGEWLAGRDPDAVEAANAARRARRSVDPFGWPGGTIVRVGTGTDQDGAESVWFGWIDPATGLLRSMALARRAGAWEARLIESRPPAGGAVFVSLGPMSQVIRQGERAVVDRSGLPVVARTVGPAPAQDVLASDPMVVEFALP